MRVFQVDDFSIRTTDLFTHRMKVELLGTSIVKRESADFADCFAILGLVPIIFSVPLRQKW